MRGHTLILSIPLFPQSDHNRTTSSDGIPKNIGRRNPHSSRRQTTAEERPAADADVYLSDFGVLPRLLQLVLEVGPDADLAVHDARRLELAQQVLHLDVLCAVRQGNQRASYPLSDTNEAN